MARRVLTLPLYPELTDLEVEYIIDQVLDCV
jgi:dTDP-4-amino-4,6-dideoxygalactose transaminase